MPVLIVHFGMGKSGSHIVAYLQEKSEGEGVKVARLEPVEEHGFYGWLLRSFVPGLKAAVKPVDLSGYKLVYLLAPKWSYNCPPINGFIESHSLKGVNLALVVTYSKGGVSGYVERMKRKIKEKGANILGTLTIRKDEILSDRFGEIMQHFIDSLGFR